MVKEYWYVEYLERIDEIGEWEEKVVCVTRHPEAWIKCKQEYNQGMVSMNTDWYRSMSWKIVNSQYITYADYERFMDENVVRR